MKFVIYHTFAGREHTNTLSLSHTHNMTSSLKIGQVFENAWEVRLTKIAETIKQHISDSKQVGDEIEISVEKLKIKPDEVRDEEQPLRKALKKWADDQGIQVSVYWYHNCGYNESCSSCECRPISLAIRKRQPAPVPAATTLGTRMQERMKDLTTQVASQVNAITQKLETALLQAPIDVNKQEAEARIMWKDLNVEIRDNSAVVKCLEKWVSGQEGCTLVFEIDEPIIVAVIIRWKGSKDLV